MSSFPKGFHQVRLELAREPGHPGGSNATGYDLILPLDADAKLSAEEWRKHKDQCRVHRFREDEDDMIGVLARKPNGTWFFDYDKTDDDDDELAHRLGEERFVIGEYVSVRNEEGDMHTYRVVAVREL